MVVLLCLLFVFESIVCVVGSALIGCRANGKPVGFHGDVRNLRNQPATEAVAWSASHQSDPFPLKCFRF